MDEDGRLSANEALDLLYKNLHSVLDLVGALMLTLILAALLRCDESLETLSVSIATAYLFGNLLNVPVPFKLVGGLVITLFNILCGDVIRFFCIFSLQLGFACGLYILFRVRRVESAVDSNSNDSIFIGVDLGSIVLHLA